MMKGWIVVLLLVAASCLCASGREGFRVFTDSKGRAILLRIVKCDIKHDSVTVEREDEKRLTVKISGFSKSDQDYIKEWFKANELISEKNLRISFDKEVVGRREEEIRGTTYYVDSGIQEENKAGEIEYEDIAYMITFHNKSPFPLENARLEYRIYYEQSRSGQKDPKQMVLSKESTLRTVLPNKKVTFQTASVEIKEAKYYGDYTTRKPADGDVHGIRCRLTVKLSEDKTIVREFCYPRGLSDKKYTWK